MAKVAGLLLGGAMLAAGVAVAATPEPSAPSQPRVSAPATDGVAPDVRKSAPRRARGTSGVRREPAPALPCNGDVALCSRRYDEVAYATAHNAHAAKSVGFAPVVACQTSGVSAQLNAGLRALMLDVYDDGDERVLCHGPCLFGSSSHREALAEVEAFLAHHPREVVTLLYEDHAAPSGVIADLRATGLARQALTHRAGEPWPTLGEMLAAGKRLVVAAENQGQSGGWYHRLWDLASDTPYGFTWADDLSCELNRGARESSLFILNHWRNSAFDTPLEAVAGEMNAYRPLLSRARQCQLERGRLPNFVAVDFAEQGDVVAVVRRLNGLGARGRSPVDVAAATVRESLGVQ